VIWQVSNLLADMFKEGRSHRKGAKEKYFSCCFSLVLFFSIFFGSANLSAQDFTGKRTLAFLIEKDQINAAWSYLRDRYGGKDFFLKKVDPSLTSEFFSELWYEEYFDTPDLALLGGDNEIKYSIWVDNNETKPGIKNEVAEISIHDIQGYGLDLARISNFGIISGDSIQFEVAHYNVTTSPDEKHRLLGIVKRAVRPVFKDVLKKIGIENPFYLTNVVNITGRRAGFKIICKDIPMGRIYLEEVTAEKFGIESLYCILKFVHDPGFGPVAAPDEKPRIEEAIEDDLLKNLPVFRRIDETDYQLAFSELDEQLPFLKLLLRYPLIKKCGEIVLLSLFGFVVLALFFYKRLFVRKQGETTGNNGVTS
jgi:hypothetical protein